MYILKDVLKSKVPPVNKIFLHFTLKKTGLLFIFPKIPYLFSVGHITVVIVSWAQSCGRLVHFHLPALLCWPATEKYTRQCAL